MRKFMLMSACVAMMALPVSTAAEGRDTAITGVISDQIAAFLRGDAEAAFAHASPMIPEVAQVAALPGGSGNTARSDGPPPQNTPTYPDCANAEPEIRSRPSRWQQSDRV